MSKIFNNFCRTMVLMMPKAVIFKIFYENLSFLYFILHVYHFMLFKISQVNMLCFCGKS